MGMQTMGELRHAANVESMLRRIAEAAERIAAALESKGQKPTAEGGAK